MYCIVGANHDSPAAFAVQKLFAIRRNMVDIPQDNPKFCEFRRAIHESPLQSRRK